MTSCEICLVSRSEAIHHVYCIQTQFVPSSSSKRTRQDLSERNSCVHRLPRSFHSCPQSHLCSSSLLLSFLFLSSSFFSPLPRPQNQCWSRPEMSLAELHIEKKKPPKPLLYPQVVANTRGVSDGVCGRVPEDSEAVSQKASLE